MKIISYILVSAMLFASSAYAQTISPDTMLPPVEKEFPAPDAQPDIAPNPNDTAVMVPRTMVCNTIGAVREMLKEQGGQTIFMVGDNNQEAQANGDPFNGLVITLNRENSSYAVVLVRTVENLACIVMFGPKLVVIQQ